ncbi:hypothetical protein PV328_001806, partial [Microctonus aethiopoides]
RSLSFLRTPRSICLTLCAILHLSQAHILHSHFWLSFAQFARERAKTGKTV